MKYLAESDPTLQFKDQWVVKINPEFRKKEMTFWMDKELLENLCVQNSIFTIL